jgi:hypothetical protein
MGESSRVAQADQGMDEGIGWALELARGRSDVRHDLLREATSALGHLGTELADVDVCLEVEGLCLARE